MRINFKKYNNKFSIKFYFLLYFILFVIQFSFNFENNLINKSIIIDNIKRNFIIYIPDQIKTLLKNKNKLKNKNFRFPLVIALHGGGGTAKNMIKLTNNGFNILADKEKFIVVYPDAIQKHWNDGRNIKRYYSQKMNINDVKFIDKLIDFMIKNYYIDISKVFITGMSNGALMSFRLALEIPDKIKAIAPVAGSMTLNVFNNYCRLYYPENNSQMVRGSIAKFIKRIHLLIKSNEKNKDGERNQNSNGNTNKVEYKSNNGLSLNSVIDNLIKSKKLIKISLLMINGTDDPLIPWNGGYIHFYKLRLGEILSIQETFFFWGMLIKNNKIKERDELIIENKIDNIGIFKTELLNTDSFLKAVLYEIKGGGHTWPSGFQYLPERVIGRMTKNINACKIIWDFFKSTFR